MFAASKSAVKVVIQTFTANATWVAPAGVTLVNMSGAGSPAVSDSSRFNETIYISVATQGASRNENPPFAQWSTFYGEATTALGQITANSGTNQITFQRRNYIIDTDGSYRLTAYSFTTVWVVGSSGSIFGTGGTPPTSGDITYASVAASLGWIVQAGETRVLGSVGSASTGLGKTFPGGTLTGTEPYRTAVAPSTTTFNDVAVTPGVSYPIVVPAGGFITLSYVG
jgi:hypothetical protein